MSNDNWIAMFFIIAVAGVGLAVPVGLLLPDRIGAGLAAVFLLALAAVGVVVIWKHR